MAMESMRLAGLGCAEVAWLAEQLAGRRLPVRLVAELATRTAGNPLFIRELVHCLRHEGRLDDADTAFAALRAWRRVEDVIARRLTRLGGDSRRLLCHAAALAPVFELADLQAASRLETETLLDLVDEAEHAAMLEPIAPRPGFYRMAHPLIRAAAASAPAGGVARGPKESPAAG
jgi:predicted ATPase